MYKDFWRGIVTKMQYVLCKKGGVTLLFMLFVLKRKSLCLKSSTCLTVKTIGVVTDNFL